MSLNVAIDVAGVDELAAAMINVDAAMYERVTSQLRMWKNKVVEEASLIVLVRTGYLRSTIYGLMVGWYVEFGAFAHYAVFVERGTRYMRARPFLGPALTMYQPELMHIISQGIDEAIAESGLSSALA